MNNINDEDRKENEQHEEKGPLDDALSGWPFSGSALYGEGGYYQERAKMHVQKDYSKSSPLGEDVPDEALQAEIQEKLVQQIRLDIKGIEVDVRTGIVTLRGRVDSQWARQAAEEAAGSVAGVHTVHNLLELDDPRRVHGNSPLETP